MVRVVWPSISCNYVAVAPFLWRMEAVENRTLWEERNPFTCICQRKIPHSGLSMAFAVGNDFILLIHECMSIDVITLDIIPTKSFQLTDANYHAKIQFNWIQIITQMVHHESAFFFTIRKRIMGFRLISEFLVQIVQDLVVTLKFCRKTSDLNEEFWNNSFVKIWLSPWITKLVNVSKIILTEDVSVIIKYGSCSGIW